jgi:hypothetical protein
MDGNEAIGSSDARASLPDAGSRKEALVEKDSIMVYVTTKEMNAAIIG